MLWAAFVAMQNLRNTLWIICTTALLRYTLR